MDTLIGLGWAILLGVMVFVTLIALVILRNPLDDNPTGREVAWYICAIIFTPLILYLDVVVVKRLWQFL